MKKLLLSLAFLFPITANADTLADREADFVRYQNERAKTMAEREAEFNRLYGRQQEQEDTPLQEEVPEPEPEPELAQDEEPPAVEKKTSAPKYVEKPRHNVYSEENRIAMPVDIREYFAFRYMNNSFHSNVKINGLGEEGIDGSPKGFSLAYGANIGNWRAEGELASNGSLGRGNISSSAAGLFANGYYDLPTGMWFRPYIGLGLGLSYIHAETDGFAGYKVSSGDKINSIGLASQFMIGANMALSMNWAVELGWRKTQWGEASGDASYHNIQHPSHTINASERARLSSSAVFIGIKKRFDI